MSERVANGEDFINSWSVSTLKGLLHKKNSQVVEYKGYLSSNEAYSGKVALSSLLKSAKTKIIDILQHMMYGFGDDANPHPDTLSLVEDMVVEYVTNMVHKAQDIGTKRGKLLTEDFLFIIRKDLLKLNRCKELLSMNEELKQARKAFDVDERRTEANEEGS